MNTKKILGVIAVLALVAVAMVGAGAAAIPGTVTEVADASALQTAITGSEDFNVKLTGNGEYEFTSTLTIQANGIIDLNGKTITSTAIDKVIVLNAGKTLTINDASGTNAGKIKSTAAIVINEQGTVTQDPYVIYVLGTTKSNGHATLTINGGTFKGTNKVLRTEGTTVINDGVYDSTATTSSPGILSVKGALNGTAAGYDGAELTINKATITDTAAGGDNSGYGIYAMNGGIVTIGKVTDTDNSDVTVTTGQAAIGTNNTTNPAFITINSGKFTSTTPDATDCQTAIFAACGGGLTINGGEFDSQKSAIVIPYAAAMDRDLTVTINGGTFKKDKIYIGENAVNDKSHVATVSISDGVAVYVMADNTENAVKSSGATYITPKLEYALAHVTKGTIKLEKNIIIGTKSTKAAEYTVKSGVKLVVPSGITLNTPHLVVNGTVDASAGTLGISSANTLVIESGQVITQTYDQLTTGSVEIKSGGELKVTGDNVTLDNVKTKIKADTKAGAIITVNDASYRVTTDVITSGQVTTEAVTTKGTVVTLNVTPSFTFTVPASVVLSSTKNGKVTDATNCVVTVTSDLYMANTTIRVNISTNDNGSGAFVLTGTSGQATYKVGQGDGSGTPTYYSGANGSSSEVVSLTLTTTDKTKSQQIFFETIDYTTAESFSGTLNFQFSAN